jgi:hypothetical protein
MRGCLVARNKRRNIRTPRYTRSMLEWKPLEGGHESTPIIVKERLPRLALTSNTLPTRCWLMFRDAGNACYNTAAQLRCLLLCHALAAGCHGFLANNCLVCLELMPQCLRSSNKRRLPRRPQAASGPSLRRCCCCCMHTYAYVHERHGAEWTVPGERQARHRLPEGAWCLGERLHAA